MKRKMLSPLRVAVATLAAMALTLLGVQTPAMASLPDGYKVTTSRSGDNLRISMYNPGGTYLGQGYFQADPVTTDGVPGDAILACDDYADGLGMEMRMDIGSSSGFYTTDRVASTRGHNSPYCTGWQTGDIAEGTSIAFKLCLVNTTVTYCSGVYYSKA